MNMTSLTSKMNMTTVIANKRSLISGGVVVALLVVLTAVPRYAPGYPVIFMAGILMNIILTLSWVMFSAPTGYISLATAAFVGVGIYTSAILGTSLPLLVVVFLGGVSSFCLAVIVGGLTLRLKGIYFAVFTFALVELIKNFALFFELHVTGTRGRFVIPVDSHIVFYVLVGIFVMLLLTTYLIRRSKFGLALQSIGQNEEAAAHIGINVTLVKIITFAISAFFIGAAGAIVATRLTYIDPGIAFNPLFSFTPVLMALFGGTGQLYGPVLGAAVFTYLEETLITSKYAELYQLLMGTILIITILYLPRGLVGLVENLRKWVSGGQHATT